MVDASPVPPPPAVPPAGRSRRRRGRLGLAVMGAGITAGLVLLYLGGARIDRAVSDLARAPIGCTTTLAVDEPGRFTVSLETRGSLPSLPGGCPVAPGSFATEPDAVAVEDLAIRIVDADGTEVPVTDRGAERYDTPSGEGAALGTVDLAAGETTVTVEWRSGAPAADADGKAVVVAVSIGVAPNEAGSTMAVFGLAVIVAALLGGSLLLLLGRRRPVTVTVLRPPPPAGWAPPSP